MSWHCSLCKNYRVLRYGLPIIKITYHICIGVPIQYSFTIAETQAQFGSSLEIPENPFDSILILLTRIGKIPTDYSNCMNNIWPGTNHSIHQTINNRGIRNFFHVFFIFFTCRTLFDTQLKWPASGVDISLILLMLNLLSTLSMYFSGDNQSFHFVCLVRFLSQEFI